MLSRQTTSCRSCSLESQNSTLKCVSWLFGPCQAQPGVDYSGFMAVVKQNVYRVLMVKTALDLADKAVSRKHDKHMRTDCKACIALFDEDRHLGGPGESPLRSIPSLLLQPPPVPARRSKTGKGKVRKLR